MSLYICDKVPKSYDLAHTLPITIERNFISLDNQIFQRKTVNIFLPICFIICFGCSKETVFLSTHNICFG